MALRRIAKRWLPTDIIERRKLGFVLPMRTWLQNWFAKQGPRAAYFRENRVPGLNAKHVVEIVEGPIRGSAA